jgi:hypothetical protein
MGLTAQDSTTVDTSTPAGTSASGVIGVPGAWPQFSQGEGERVHVGAEHRQRRVLRHPQVQVLDPDPRVAGHPAPGAVLFYNRG